MIKKIVTDQFFLKQKAETAIPSDVSIGEDLIDTLKANEERCVGMAANMIGEKKNIIIVNDNGFIMLMYNPKIIRCSGKYQTEEGCLSLTGSRKTDRYEKVTVEYLDNNWKKKIKTFTGFSSQIIQHEIDHCNGVLI